MIETRRLRLRPGSPRSLRAELDGTAELANVVGVAVPPNWPPELYDRSAVEYTLRRLGESPDTARWWVYYFARAGVDGEECLVGCGGYKGPPDSDGIVEIGYSVLPQFRRQGYASEAVEGLARNAFSHPDVEVIAAETLPELAASIGVLEKCGFSLEGQGSEPGVLRYLLRREGTSRRAPRC